jgi:hypothetical protein
MATVGNNRISMADAATPREQSQEDRALVEQILLGFAQKRTRRYNFETQWQEAALLAWPEFANTFFYGYDQMPGTKKTQQQVDSSASIASHRFGAIMDSLMTPSSIMWSEYQHSDPYVMKQRKVKEYYGALSRAMWDLRYDPTANFVGQNQQNLQGLGVFGNMTMYTDELDMNLSFGKRGLRYCSIPVGQMYYGQNHQGQVDHYYRAFRWNARQIKQKWPDTFPAALQGPLDQRSETLFWVVQFVCPRTDYQPWRFDKKGKRWASYYVSVEGHCLLEEGGYRTFPIAPGRYMQAPDEDYGRGPAQMVLPTLKTKNAQKGVFLKQGHRAGDPVYLGPEDGIVDPQFHPGAYNPGGVDSEGRRLIQVLETGNIQITQEMMQEEGQIIDDAFLVTLFKLALKSEDEPSKTARQVVEMIEQKGMFLAPTAGRQQAEYLGALQMRELDVAAHLGLLSRIPMPDVLREARGAGVNPFKIKYTNPLTRAMQAGEVSSYMQMVEMGAEVARSTGSDEIWDQFDFDTSWPEIAERRGVPVTWMSNDQVLAKKRKARQDAAAAKQRLLEMPAQAAIIKAQAIQAKAGAGQNIGGTLSGTPATQMPQVPGAPQGISGNPAATPGGQGTPGIPAPPQ